MQTHQEMLHCMADKMWNINFKQKKSTSIESTTGKYNEFTTLEFLPTTELQICRWFPPRPTGILFPSNMTPAGRLTKKFRTGFCRNMPSCPHVCRLSSVLFHQDQLSLSACTHFWSVLTFGMCVSLIQSVLTFVLILFLSLGQVGGCPKSSFIVL